MLFFYENLSIIPILLFFKLSVVLSSHHIQKMTLILRTYQFEELLIVVFLKMVRTFCATYTATGYACCVRKLRLFCNTRGMFHSMSLLGLREKFFARLNF